MIQFLEVAQSLHFFQCPQVVKISCKQLYIEEYKRINVCLDIYIRVQGYYLTRLIVLVQIMHFVDSH